MVGLVYYVPDQKRYYTSMVDACVVFDLTTMLRLSQPSESFGD